MCGAKDFQKKKHFADGEVSKFLPNVTFEDSLHFADDGVYLFHTPGHTAGCISIYDEMDKILCIIGHNKPHKKDVLSAMEDVLMKAWEEQKRN